MDNIHPMDGMESSTILLILSLLLSNVSPMPNKTRNKAQQIICLFFLLQNSRWEFGGGGGGGLNVAPHQKLFKKIGCFVHVWFIVCLKQQ
jgi:hypothetical protein